VPIIFCDCFLSMFHLVSPEVTAPIRSRSGDRRTRVRASRGPTCGSSSLAPP
jgi:hypothetical protein